MGGIGGRGPGETKLEVDRRRVRDRIHHLENPRTAARAPRPARRAARNAGRFNRRLHERRKVTLLNALTNSQSPPKIECLRRSIPRAAGCDCRRSRKSSSTTPSALSATCRKICSPPLEPRLKRWKGRICLFIWWTRAARSLKIRLLRSKILGELKLSEIPRLLVFNKADLLNEDELENMKRAHPAVVISALNRNSLLPMIERVGEMLDDVAASKSKRDGKETAQALEMR